MELSGDGYQVDVLGESTPDVLVIEFVRFLLFIFSFLCNIMFECLFLLYQSIY
jgi:hypothetical protein